MRRTSRNGFLSLFAAGLLLALVLPVAAQLPPHERGFGAPERPGPAAGQIPQRFDAVVSRVRVDVIVTDDDGAFVDDLTAEDFILYEDGERQPILGVQLVDLAAGNVRYVAEERAAAPEAGAEAPEAPAPSTAASADQLGAVIFLIDGPGLSVQSRARFGDAWSQLLDDTAALQVPRAAYMVDNVGRLQELASLGDDPEALHTAADTVREAPFFGDRTRQRLIELANDLEDPFIPDEARQRLAAATARSYEGQERSRSLASYELLTSFAEALGTRSGRTALVWVTSGIKLMQGGPYVALLESDRANRDAFSPDPMIYAAQQELHRAANSSNVSLYTVDPSLLAGTRFAGTDVQVATAGGGTRLSTPEMQQSLDGLRDALRSAAAETGGRSFIRATDLGLVLREIEADTSRFYLLTYAPPPPAGDGEYHAIEVEVQRDDVDVRARGGYVDHSAGDRARRRIAGALALPGSITDLPVEAEAFVSRRDGEAPNVLLAVAVDGAELGVTRSMAGERQVSLAVHAVAVQGDTIADESHEQLDARSTVDAPTAGPQEGPLRPTLFGFMAYQREWTLAPGAYTFNVAVHDNVTGRIGAASVDVEVAAPSEAWGIGDPLIVTIDEAGRVHPVVLGRVVPGQNLAAFVEVYGGVRPILSGRVLTEEAAEGQVQVEETAAAADAQGGTDVPGGARLFPLALRRVGDLHRGAAPLPAGMPPGRYVVQLVVTDAPAEQHHIVRLPLEVVGRVAR